MKRAPNVKKLPEDKYTEAIIFAGDEAWNAAKRYMQDPEADDPVPPIVLDLDQLEHLSELDIIDENRHRVRIYQAGRIAQLALTQIAYKLALANVQYAVLYDLKGNLLEDWTSQLARLKSDAAELLASQQALSDGTPLAEADLKRLEALNNEYTHVLLSGEHYVVSVKPHAVTGRTHTFQTLRAFRNNFLADKPIAGKPPGNAWLQWPGHTSKTGGIGFYPQPGLCPPDICNLFTGFITEPLPGDISPFLYHVEQVICAGDKVVSDYLLQWMAHLIQRPEEKPSVAIVMKSVEGTGKNTLVRPLLQILGPYAAQINGIRHLTGRFNSTLANKLLVFVDEAEMTEAGCADRLKAIISEPVFHLERKGMEPEPVPNCARMIFASNHEQVIRAGLYERRFLVLEPDARRIRDKDYFDRLYRWLDENGAAHLLHWLQHLDLTGFDPRRAPVTQALREEKIASLPMVHQFMLAELETTRPFSGMARLTATELVERFLLWSTTHRLPLSPAAARAMSGKLMQRLGIPVQGRSGRGIGKYYELPEEDVLRQKFAAMLGETGDTIFG